MNLRRFLDWLKPHLKRYAVQVAVTFVIGVIAFGISSLISVSRVRTVNESVMRNVANWEPTQLARVYYGELLNGGLYSVKWTRALRRIPQAFFVLTAANIPFASISTLKRYVLDGGTAQVPPIRLSDNWTEPYIPRDDAFAPAPDAPGNPIIGLLGFALGVLSIAVVFRYHRQTRGFGFWLAIFLLAPLAGSLIMWLAAMVMTIAGGLLGAWLNGVESVTVAATTFPLLGILVSALFKPIEGAVEGRLTRSVATRLKM